MPIFTVRNKLNIMNRNSIINELSSIKSELTKYGVVEIGLFGSYLNENQTKLSDIDILIHFKPECENFDNFMLVYDILENQFKNIKIDVVTKNGLSKYIGPYILKEVVYA